MMIKTRTEKIKMLKSIERQLPDIHKEFFAKNVKLVGYEKHDLTLGISEQYLLSAELNLTPKIEEIVADMAEREVQVHWTSQIPRDDINGKTLARDLAEYRDNLLIGGMISKNPPKESEEGIPLELIDSYLSFRQQILNFQVHEMISAVTFKKINFEDFLWRLPYLEASLIASASDLRKMVRYKSKILKAFQMTCEKYWGENKYELVLATKDSCLKFPYESSYEAWAIASYAHWCELGIVDYPNGTKGLRLYQYRGNPNSSDALTLYFELLKDVADDSPESVN